MKEILITWRDIEKSKIWLRDYKGRVDKVVCILRGGSILSTIASHILVVPVHYIEFSSYNMKNKRHCISYKNFSIDSSLEGKRVLLIDDIWDSGTTIQNTRKIIEKQNPKSIQTFVLVTKEPKKCWDNLVNFYTACTKKCWVVFPWEV